MSKQRGKRVSRPRHNPTLHKAQEFVQTNKANNVNRILTYSAGDHTSSNHSEWLEQLKEDALKEHPNLRIFGTVDQVDKVTADLVYPPGVDAARKASLLQQYSTLYKNNNFFNEENKKSRTTVFQLIMDRLSEVSKQRVKSDPRYYTECYVEANEQQYNPFKLLELIRNIHVGFIGNNHVNVEVARANFHTRLQNMTQGNDDLLIYAKRFVALRTEEQIFVKANPRPTILDPTVTEVVNIFESEKLLSIKFMSTLNARYKEAVSHYQNNVNENKPVFSTVMEAYQFVDRYVCSNPDMRDVTALLTKANKDNKPQPQKQKRKGNKLDQKVNKAVKKLNDCWLCKKLNVRNDGGIKHFYPNDCPSAKVYTETKKRKRDEDTPVDDANTDAANAFLANVKKNSKK